MSDVRNAFCTAALALCLAASIGLSEAAEAATGADWSPRASEELVKLPTAYLEKAIDRDFESSGLGGRLREIDQAIADKAQTISDLKAASAEAEGDLAVELTHQMLAEKHGYVELLGERQDLRRRKAEASIRLYEDLARRAKSERRRQSEDSGALHLQLREARARMETAIDAVDLNLLDNPGLRESRYGVEYDRNKAAIDKLAESVADHRMNFDADRDGPLDRESYLEERLQMAHAEVALLDQEENILAYMAKLVALDAMALALDVEGGDPGSASVSADRSPAASADLFVTN